MQAPKWVVGVVLSGLVIPSIAATTGRPRTPPSPPPAAPLINPTSAVGSSEFSASYLALNAINGSGLPARFTTSDAHGVYAAGNHWTTDGTAPTDEFITFGFNTPQDLGRIHLWNHQSNGGIASNPGYDVTALDLIFLASNGTTVLASLDNVALLPDLASAQTLSFPRVNDVSFVRLEIEATQSSTTFTGLGEVAFELPEPGCATLLTAGTASLLIRRRRSVETLSSPRRLG